MRDRKNYWDSAQTTISTNLQYLPFLTSYPPLFLVLSLVFSPFLSFSQLPSFLHSNPSQVSLYSFFFAFDSISIPSVAICLLAFCVRDHTSSSQRPPQLSDIGQLVFVSPRSLQVGIWTSYSSYAMHPFEQLPIFLFVISYVSAPYVVMLFTILLNLFRN